MDRRDTHLDGMLRHLGAAYYETLHGRAAASDLSRALDRVAEHMGEKPVDHGTAAGREHVAGQQGDHRPPEHHGRWHSRVRDIMTTSVVTVDRITSYKEIAEKLAESQISGMPVLMLGRHVAGVVTEADLIAGQSKRLADRRSRLSRALHPGQGHVSHPGLTAAELMTTPAITIHPDATIPAAARLMSTHHIRRLPVVDTDGKLLGLVSRRDILRLFLRDDAAIARQVSELLAEILPGEQPGIKVAVHGGVVTLTGEPVLDGQQDLLPVALRLTWDIDGVVDVVDKIGVETRPA
jgi:CBS domain-containing protein